MAVRCVSTVIRARAGFPVTGSRLSAFPGHAPHYRLRRGRLNSTNPCVGGALLSLTVCENPAKGLGRPPAPALRATQRHPTDPRLRLPVSRLASDEVFGTAMWGRVPGVAVRNFGARSHAPLGELSFPSRPPRLFGQQLTWRNGSQIVSCDVAVWDQTCRIRQPTRSAWS